MGGGEQDDIVSIVGSSPYDGDKRQIGRTPLSSTLSGEARRSRRLVTDQTPNPWTTPW